MLAFFNLLPIYPLDGFRLLDVFLKRGNAYSTFMYRYGNYTLIGLILLSIVFRNLNLDVLDIFTWANTLINNILGWVL
jgi:Zn-dependent protease